MLIEILPIALLAIDIQAVIFVLFLLFSFIGFISNLVKGNAGNQQRQARGRQPRRGGQLQNEIDDFLKDVLGDQQPKRPQQRGAVEVTDDDLEIVEESEFQRQQEDRQRRERERREKERRNREIRQQQEREQRERQRRQQEADRRRREKKQSTASAMFDDEAQRPRKTLKDRHIESTVESHVKTYMNHTVEQQHLERGTVAPLAEESGADASSPIARELHALLKSPQGIRQAILVNEILSRPKSLQSRSS